MTIPSMPTILRWWRNLDAPVAIQYDLYGRVVPSMRVWGGPPFAGAYSSITHWVDLPAGTTVRGGYDNSLAFSTTIAYTFTPSLADFFVVCSLPPWRNILIVLGVETRYLDADGEYVRCWCHATRSVPGFSDTCP